MVSEYSEIKYIVKFSRSTVDIHCIELNYYFINICSSIGHL